MPSLMAFARDSLGLASTSTPIDDYVRIPASQTSLGALYSCALLRLQSNRHLLQNQQSGQENEGTLTFRFISFTGTELPLASDTLISCGQGD